MSEGSYQNKVAITAEHILQQRHGIEWDETQTDYRNPLNPVAQMVESDDWYEFVLTWPVDAGPGQKFTYRNGGIHNGQRILDQAWVDASWTKYSHSGNSDFFPEPGWGHGYQWWVAEAADALDRNWHVFFASGWGSQVIFVVPELGLVLVTTGDNYAYNGPGFNLEILENGAAAGSAQSTVNTSHSRLNLM